MAPTAKLEQKIDLLTSSVNSLTTHIEVLTVKHQNTCNRVDDLVEVVGTNQKRIGRLENWRNWIVGAGTVASGVVGYMGRVLLDHLSKP